MYNPEVKEKFLESIESKTRRDDVRSLFEQVSDIFEEPNQTDIIHATTEQVKETLKKCGWISKRVVRYELSLLRDYAEWYYSNIAPVDVLQIKRIKANDIDISYAIKSKFFKDTDDFVSVIKKMPLHDGCFEIPLLCLAWYGLNINECLSLKDEDITIGRSSCRIDCGTQRIVIYNTDVIYILRDYVETESATRKRKNVYFVYKDSSPYFLKQMLPKEAKIHGEMIDRKYAQYVLTKRIQTLPEFSEKLWVSRLNISGSLYRLYLRESAGETLSEEEIHQSLRCKYKSDSQNLYMDYKETFWQ